MNSIQRKDVFLLSIEVKEINFANYSKCLSISNGLIEVYVTIDVGPRIIYFGKVGGKNILFNDTARQYVVKNESISSFYGPESEFLLYGGHRMWLSPERMPQTYYPDNTPVMYTPLPDGASFTPPPQRGRDLQLNMEIIMSPQALDIMVVHTLTNISPERRNLAIWAITDLIPGGTVVVPQNKNDTDTLPNRTISLWPYCNVNDERFFLGNAYATLHASTKAASAFKFGCNNHAGWGAYVHDEFTFVKRYVHNTEAKYPDFASSFEAYTDKNYMSMESLSPLYYLESREQVRHVENWSLFDTPKIPNIRDEASIDAFVNQL